VSALPGYSGNRLHTNQKAASGVNRYRVSTKPDPDNEHRIIPKVVVESEKNKGAVRGKVRGTDPKGFVLLRA
jgi:hypothetical protein